MHQNGKHFQCFFFLQFTISSFLYLFQIIFRVPIWFRVQLSSFCVSFFWYSETKNDNETMIAFSDYFVVCWFPFTVDYCIWLKLNNQMSLNIWESNRFSFSHTMKMSCYVPMHFNLCKIAVMTCTVYKSPYRIAKLCTNSFNSSVCAISVRKLIALVALNLYSSILNNSLQFTSQIHDWITALVDHPRTARSSCILFESYC